jgi:hypothetical protein
MTTKRKAQGGVRGKVRRASAADCKSAAVALHALMHAGGFDFINNMIGETVAAVTAGLGIGLPNNWRNPVTGPSVEDLAAWFAKIPPTFDPDDAQVSPPAELSADAVFARNPLTSEQAGKIAAGLFAEIQDDAEIARLLLLCHALTFEPDMTSREGLLNAIEKEAGPLLVAVDDALNNVKRRQYETLKGGAQ